MVQRIIIGVLFVTLWGVLGWMVYQNPADPASYSPLLFIGVTGLFLFLPKLAARLRSAEVEAWRDKQLRNVTSRGGPYDVG